MRFSLRTITSGACSSIELFQPVVAVDHAAVEVVQIGRGETAAIQRHERSQFRRNHRNYIQNHPFRLVTGLTERFHDAQPLGELQLLLDRSFGLHLLANLFAELLDVNLLQQFLDAFGAHHRDELAGMFLVELPLAFVGDDFAAG